MIGCAFERFQVVHRLTAVRLPIQQLLGRQRALPNNTGASCCPIQKSGAEGECGLFASTLRGVSSCSEATPGLHRIVLCHNWL